MDTSPSFVNLRRHADQLRAAGIRGRYAPSPSGPLHLGNARTALLAWLQARLEGGQFIMRMEDLDTARVQAASAEQILDDLRWMGIDWDEGPDMGGPCYPYEQHLRSALYDQAFQILLQQGRLFPCFCSRKDIAEAASAPHASLTPGVYPGTCRSLVCEETTASAPVVGIPGPAWRYRIPDRTIEFQDQVIGTVRQDLVKEVGDFVLRRADSVFAYQLAVVIDDALMGITDVVRGADLLDSTPRQIELFEALGLSPPRYWHVPLMKDSQGARLAKRDGSLSIAAHRRQGDTPQALVGMLAGSLGLVPRSTILSTQELLQQLDLATFRTRLGTDTLLNK